MATENAPVRSGNRGAAVLPYLQYGIEDPTVTPTAGSPGMLYIRIPFDGAPPTAIGLYQKITTEGIDTNWQLISSGSSPTVSDYKDPVDTVNPIGTNIDLAAPGASINGVAMAAGMSFLVVNQTLPEENGIYEWNGAAVPATRRSDANTDALVTKGMFTWVNQGPTQRGLTGWILTTANPITLDSTPLTFAQIPINAGTSTRIPGVFFVAANGLDTNPSTRGAIAAPFASIQAAINQAVAEGYNQSNQLVVMVMPKSSTYGGFSTSPGISVSGIMLNKFMPRVQHANIVCDGAGINANTGCSISNLQLVSTAQHSLNFPAGNQGRWTINNCRILNATVGFSAVFMDNAGSVLNLEGCDVVSNSATPAITYLAGGNLLIRGGSVESQDICILNSGGVLNVLNARIQTTAAAGYAIDNFGFIQALMDCQIYGLGTAGGLIVRNGGFAAAVNNYFVVNAPAYNYEVEVGGSLNKSLLSMNGTSTDFLESGFVTTMGLSGVGYNPAVPTNYPGTAPTDMKPALDRLAAMVNYANPRQVYVDAVSGSDVTGNGCQQRPYQSLHAALAAIALLPAGDYVLELAIGDYGGPPIAWPSQSTGYNVSINGSGAGCTISAAISLTSGAGANEQLFFQNVGITANPVTVDFTLAAIGTMILANGGFAVDRVDSLPPGPQAVRVFNSLITSISTNSVVIVVNGQWIGGAPNVIGASGNLLLQSCLAAAMQYDVAAGGQLLLDATIATFSTFNIEGTMTMLSTVTASATIAGTGLLISDASSLSFGATVTIASTSLADQAQNVGYTPANPGDWTVPPTEVKGALDELAARPVGGAQAVEYRTVTAPEAAAKQLTLAAAPTVPGETTCQLAGVGQFYGDDFTVAGAILDWNGLGMDTIGVAAGDKLIISYN